MTRQATFLSLALVAILGPNLIAESPEMQIYAQGKSVVGLPIHWDSQTAVLLKPSGAMQLFDQTDIQSYKLLSSNFQPQTHHQIRSQLQLQLGKNFDILVSGPYVIAAPRGGAKRWHRRFMSLWGGFKRYYDVRGWKLRQPDFPLQVIVLRSRSEFVQFSSGLGSVPAPNTVGSYFPSSNICILYQLPSSSGTNWSETEATIVHEAVHQLAFNSGIHERLFSNPLWCVEGLATMFEEPSVYDPNIVSSTVETRINRRQVAALGPALDDLGQLETLLASLIATDDVFQSDTGTAYAAAWALTFYLSERMPREYQHLTKLQMARGLGDYSAAERIADFRSAIGVPPSMLARQIQRLLKKQ